MSELLHRSWDATPGRIRRTIHSDGAAVELQRRLTGIGRLVSPIRPTLIGRLSTQAYRQDGPVARRGGRRRTLVRIAVVITDFDEGRFDRWSVAAH